MKHSSKILTFTALALVLAACGKYEKNPTPQLDELHKNSQTAEEQNREAEIERRATEKARAWQEQQNQQPQPKVIEKEVVVTKEVPVVKEQATIGSDSFLLRPQTHSMSFTEGQKGSYQIRVGSTLANVEVELKSTALPEGASLQKDAKEAGLYNLVWTPALSFVPVNENLKTVSVKLSVQMKSAKDESIRKKLETVTREAEITLSVFHPKDAPSEITVENLPTDVSEGTVTSFSITAKVPGIDDKSSKKPSLSFFLGAAAVQGATGLKELDGSRHVFMDSKKKDPEYLGNFKWKFNLVFDTENVAVQPALTAGGTVAPLAEGTPIRLMFRVLSPFGSSSAEFLKQLKVASTKPLEAPRFDLSALNNQALELVPGQKASLKFAVLSQITGPQIKVEIPDLKALKGSPSIKCVVNKKSVSRQDCELTWNVPCDANEQDLKQEIALSASSLWKGRNSEVSKATITTALSAKTNKCVEKKK